MTFANRHARHWRILILTSYACGLSCLIGCGRENQSAPPQTEMIEVKVDTGITTFTVESEAQQPEDVWAALFEDFLIGDPEEKQFQEKCVPAVCECLKQFSCQSNIHRLLSYESLKEKERKIVFNADKSAATLFGKLNEPVQIGDTQATTVEAQFVKQKDKWLLASIKAGGYQVPAPAKTK